jgi:hypothetical protein
MLGSDPGKLGEQIRMERENVGALRLAARDPQRAGLKIHVRPAKIGDLRAS